MKLMCYFTHTFTVTGPRGFWCCSTILSFKHPRRVKLQYGDNGGQQRVALTRCNPANVSDTSDGSNGGDYLLKIAISTVSVLDLKSAVSVY